MPFLRRKDDSPFDRKTPFREFLESGPLKYVTQHIYHMLLSLRGPPNIVQPHQTPLRIVCISDTHCLTHPSIPDGDILIHAGDLTNKGTAEELQRQLDWIDSLPHKLKVVLAGNHDDYFDPRARSKDDWHKKLKLGDIHYLCRSSTTVEVETSNGQLRRVNIYGAPQSPWCDGGAAFQYQRNEDMWKETIPIETDILVTHTPPAHHRDLPVGLGCNFLLQEVWRVKPILHVFGHIHEDAGKEVAFWDYSQQVYERSSARKSGFVTGLFNIFAWLDLLSVVSYGISEVLWYRIWGGVAYGSWLVNAALMNQNTKQISNPVQVVEM